MSIFRGHQVISNHGTKQGIIPRFWLQTMELAESTFGKAEGDKKLGDFFPNNVNDLTNLYDLYHEIVTEYNDYKAGLSDGRYFSINEKSQFTLDQSVELKFEKKIKDFFILGRLLVNNFAKSTIIDSEHFVLNKLIIVTDKNFEKNKLEYVELDPSKRFIPLFDIIENARKEFLNEFNSVRAEIEHNNFSIPKFDINTENGDFAEPSIHGNAPLIEELEYYYNNLLDLVETLIAYYFGIEAVSKNNNLALYIRKDYDFQKTVSKYMIFPRALPMANLELVF